jgi:hypothetical protein
MPKKASKTTSAVAGRRDAFAKRVKKLLRSDPRVASVKPHETEFAFYVTLGSGEKPLLFLDNFFAESADIDPDERDEYLRERFESLFVEREADDSWEAVAPKLLPTLRCSVFELSLPLVEKGASSSTVKRPFLPFLDVHLAIDSDATIRYASRSSLEDWEVTEKKAFERAMANAKKLPPPVLYDKKLGPLFYVDENDSYESSRLAVPGFLASFAGKVDGRPLAIVPERAQLYVGGDGRDKMVARLVEMAEREYEASTRAISPALYTVDDAGKVVPYLRKKRDALRGKVLLGHVKLALREYAEQKEVLDKVHERDDIDLFVATLNGVLRPDGRPVTWCMWGEEIDSLLPVAELVMLAGQTDEGDEDSGWSFFVPWSLAEATMGKAWRPEPKHHPLRVHPRGWPTKAQMKRLRAGAVEVADVE